MNTNYKIICLLLIIFTLFFVIYINQQTTKQNIIDNCVEIEHYKNKIKHKLKKISKKFIKTTSLPYQLDTFNNYYVEPYTTSTPLYPTTQPTSTQQYSNSLTSTQPLPSSTVKTNVTMSPTSTTLPAPSTKIPSIISEEEAVVPIINASVQMKSYPEFSCPSGYTLYSKCMK